MTNDLVDVLNVIAGWKSVEVKKINRNVLDRDLETGSTRRVQSIALRYKNGADNRGLSDTDLDELSAIEGFAGVALFEGELCVMVSDGGHEQ